MALSDQQVETFIYQFRQQIQVLQTQQTQQNQILNSIQTAINQLTTDASTSTSGNNVVANTSDSYPYQGGILHKLVHTFNAAVNLLATLAVSGAATLQSTLGVTGVATFTAAPVFSSTTASQPLKVNSSKALTSGLISLASDVTGTLAVGNGGTGQTTLAAHNVLVGNSTGGVTQVNPLITGWLLTSNGTGADPSFQAAPVTSVNTRTGAITLTDSDVTAVVVTPGTCPLAKLTTSGSNGSFTINAYGRITAFTAPT